MRAGSDFSNFVRIGVVAVAAVLAGCGPKEQPAKSEPPAKAATAPAPKPVAPPPAAAPKPAPPPPAAAPKPAAPPPVAAAPAQPAKPPAPAEWTLLGTQRVGFNKTERDRIDAGGRGMGHFREVRFTVKGAPVEVYELTITFANGEQFKPTMKLHFDEKTASPVIDLPGEKRSIRHIDIVYRSVSPKAAEATLSVYGR